LLWGSRLLLGSSRLRFLKETPIKGRSRGFFCRFCRSFCSYQPRLKFPPFFYLLFQTLIRYCFFMSRLFHSGRVCRRCIYVLCRRRFCCNALIDR
jgi:hypothetical protein